VRTLPLRSRRVSEWPLPETQWVKYYLGGWEQLSTDVPRPSAEVGNAHREPDVFTQMPLKKTTKVERLRYMTEPLPHDVLVAGPISLTLYAEIDQSDTNWLVVLKDVGPDVAAVTARVGERAVPETLPERELTRGWLRRRTGQRILIDPGPQNPSTNWRRIRSNRLRRARSSSMKSSCWRRLTSSKLVIESASKSVVLTCLRERAR
jgi:hypothetical protein